MRLIPMTQFGCYLKMGLALAGAIVAASAAGAVKTSSPDGQVVATVDAVGGNLVYTVTFREGTVIEPSPLGVTVNGVNLGSGVTLGGPTSYAANETFASRHGIHARGTNHYQGQTIAVNHAASGLSYVVDLRVYDDGVAFRYELGGAGTKNLTAESSGFVLPANSMVWFQGSVAEYEKYYRGTNITAMAANTVLGPPVTIELPDAKGHLALTECNLSEGGVFPNPYLVKSAGETGRELQVAYPANQGGTTGASVSGPVKTPWNVIMIGADLNRLVNNDLMESLAPAPDGALFPQGTATSWATMGRSVWDWIRHPASGITHTNAMTNSFWASQMGFEYNTVDEGWAAWRNASGAVDPWPLVREVVDFSHARGVKVLLWKRSSELNTQAQRTAFFQQLQSCGVDGFKADFFDFNSVSPAARERTKLQEDILRDAARYQLVVNLHGTSRPTGQFRTYPNLIGMEAVFGKEQFPNPWMVATVPLTRFLAGPADFTPLEFGGNVAFEIAHVVNMPGPLITLAEWPDRIAKSPFASLIRSIPCQWDETVVLSQSKLGATTATARRKGEDWYIGIMNAGMTQSWNLDLSFLAPDVTYQADIVRQDSKVLERTNVTRESVFRVAVTTTNGSGFVARLSRLPVSALNTNSVLKGAIIGAKGSWAGSSNTKEKASDGDLSTYFDGPDANGVWMGLDLGAGNQRVVRTLRYCPRASWAGRMVGGVFQGANAADFSDAVTLWTVGYCPPEGSFTTVTLTNRTAFRYLRYLSPPDGWGNVAEVQFGSEP